MGGGWETTNIKAVEHKEGEKNGERDLKA